MKGWLACCALLVAAPAVRADEVAVSTPTEPELRRELLARTEVEQKIRNAIVAWTMEHGPLDPKRATPQQQAAWDKLTAEMIAGDRDNTAWLKQVVAKRGWPTVTLVGRDGANAAWLLVQHADLDAKFQRECLGLMTRLPAEEVSQKDLAYLTDRVLVAEGKPQRCGTQFHVVDGKPQPRPIEDPEHVDERRAKLGLSTMAEYAKLIEKSYGPAK